MHSTLLNAIVQTIAGLVSGVAVGAPLRYTVSDSFSISYWAPSAVDSAGLSFRRRFRAWSTASGEPNLGGSPADDLAIRVLAGFITGGMLVLIFCVLRFAKNEHFNNK